MKRRAFLASLAVAAWSPGVAAQPSVTRRVGLLWLQSPEVRHFREAMLDGLREQGWIEGRNFVLDDATAEDYDRLIAAAERLVARKPSVIMTWGYTSLRAARRATSSIPIVMNAGIDPVKTGFAASLGRPGGNVTGISTLNTELQGKQVELVRETLPGAKRVIAILDPTSGAQTGYFSVVEAQARRLGIEFDAVDIRRPEELEPAIAAAARQSVDALYVIPSTMLQRHSRQIGALALKHRMPSFAYSAEYADGGVLLTYGVNRAAVFRRAGGYAGRILKGAAAADLPIERAAEFELIVNLKTARALGVAVPPAVLVRARRTVD